MPEIKIQSVVSDPVRLTAGVSGILTIFLNNVGMDQAKDITVKITGGREILASSVFSVGKIDPGKSETVILGVSVDRDAKPGKYLLQVTMRYKGTLEHVYEDTSFVEVQIFEVPTIFTTLNLAIMGGLGATVMGVFVIARRLGYKLW